MGVEAPSERGSSKGLICDNCDNDDEESYRFGCCWFNGGLSCIKGF